MNPRPGQLLFASALALLLWLWLAPTGLRELPAARFTALNGTAVDLPALRGKPLLVNFWATTCPSCVKEMPQLAALHEEFSPRGFQVIAIAMSYDPEAQVRALVSNKNYPFTVALDKDGALARAFGEVMLTPTTFLIAPDGQITQTILGEADFPTLRAQLAHWLAAAH